MMIMITSIISFFCIYFDCTAIITRISNTLSRWALNKWTKIINIFKITQNNNLAVRKELFTSKRYCSYLHLFVENMFFWTCELTWLMQAQMNNLLLSTSLLSPLSYLEKTSHNLFPFEQEFTALRSASSFVSIFLHTDATVSIGKISIGKQKINH